jgi:small subunit ribosomal protein S4e
MVKLHLKRLASPSTWPIPKKTLKYIARPNPGAHKLEHQVPVSLFLRDIVGLLHTQKEVKYVLHNKDCLIDGKVCHDNKRPVGLLDVVSLPKAKEYFRVGINAKNKIVALPINEKEATTKVCKITKKSSLRKGLTQLNTLDGRNFLIDDTKKYAVGDSLVISLPDQKIVDHLPFQTGMTILLDAGKHVGAIATVEEIEGNIIVVKVGDESFRTKKAYALIIGKNKPIITVE